MREGSQIENVVLARGESVSIRQEIPSTNIYEILASACEQNKGHSVFVGHKTWQLGIMTTQGDIGRIQFEISSNNSPVLNSPFLLTLFSLLPLIKALIFNSFAISQYHVFLSFSVFL